MNRRTAITIAAAAVVSAGCAADQSDPPSAVTQEPVSATVVVSLVDDLPVKVLQNGGAGQCTSVNVLDTAFGGSATPPVEVTVRDADGTIVATERLPEDGGVFTRNVGCTWDLTFEVDSSGFYEVTVTSKTGEAVVTAETVDGRAKLVVAL